MVSTCANSLLFLLFLMLIIFAMALGLLVNYFSGGLSFSAFLCIFAGLFLVMPGLLNFDIKDFVLLRQHKKLTIINILLNVFVIPAIFVISGILFFPHTPEIRYALALLWILPGGGLLMSRIRQSHANGKYWFALFVLSMSIFVVAFVVLNYLIMHNFVDRTIDAWELSCELDTLTQGTVSCAWWNAQSKPLLAYFFLVLLPFVLSRLIRHESWIEKIKKYIPIISQAATFLIVLYVFSLENIHGIFTQEPIALLKIFAMVTTGYLWIYALTYGVYRFHKQQWDFKKSFFWNATIRFVTLWVVFGFLYVPYLGVHYITIFASAYIIQTILSSLSLKLLQRT